MKKPLLWSRLSKTERFDFVDPDKIINIVMDDGVDMDRVRKEAWYHELQQTKVGVERIKKWSEREGHLQDDDLFISADVDEVMSPAALQQLKWCQTKEVRRIYDVMRKKSS